MTRDSTVQVVIRAKNEYHREFGELRRELQTLGHEGSRATDDVTRGLQQMGREASTLGRRFSSLGQQIISTAAGFLVRDVVVGSWNRLRNAVVGVGEAMISVNRKWEMFEAQYYVQLGRSHAAARQRMEEIEEFALRTPFELEGIIQADQILQVFGLHASQAAQRFGMSGREIRAIAGDIAAGTRASFEEIAMWLGRFSVGDTGRALRRFQELGVVTSDELRQMGVAFSSAGQMITPVDEAFSALLQLAREKFGGLMEIESSTLQGMESNLADFMTRQKRLWGEPLFDLYKDGLRGLLTFLDSEGAQGLLAAGQRLWGTLLDSLRNTLGRIAAEIGSWVSQALLWGENIATSLAYGIGGPVGVMQVGRAVGNLGREIQRLLQPGSPPKLLPQLTNWGAGAAAAWLEGWVGATPLIEPYLRDLMRSLEPFLRQVEEGGEWDVAGFREAFGPRAVSVEGYIWAYERVYRAVRETELAREALAEAEASGDEEEVAAAQERLTLAEQEEARARAALQAEQRRIAQKAAAEMELTRAIREQTAAVVERARIEREADAAREDAAARQLYQARLQLELAEAETPARQLEIWRRELAATQEETVEWYQIRTTIVRLEQQIRREQEAAVQQARQGLGLLDEDLEMRARASSLDKLRQQQMEEGLQREKELRQDINYLQEQAAREGQVYTPEAEPGVAAWFAVGKAIAGHLWAGFVDWVRRQWDAWVDRVSEWAQDPVTVQGFATAGRRIGQALGAAIAGGLQGMGELQQERERAMRYWQERGEEELARAGSTVATVEELLGGAVSVGPTLGEALATLAAQLVGAFWDAFSREFQERGGFWGLLERAIWGEEGMGERLGEWITETLVEPPVQWANALAEWIRTTFGGRSPVATELQDRSSELGADAADLLTQSFGAGLSDSLQEEVRVALDRISLVPAEAAGTRLGSSLLQSLRSALGLGGAPLRPLAAGERGIMAFQAGTTYAPGGLAVVGERGPELVELPRGSRVYDSRQTAAALAPTQTFHNWFEGAIQIVVPGGDPERVRGSVLEALRSAGVAT